MTRPVSAPASPVTKRKARGSLSKKRRRGRRKRQETETEESELDEEAQHEEATSEKEEPPPSRAVDAPEGTPTRGNEDTTRVSFSDGDEDMNVDFDADTDEDVRNEGYEGDGDPSGSAATPRTPEVTEQDNGSRDAWKEDGSPDQSPGVPDCEETMDTDTENSVEEEDQMHLGAPVEGRFTEVTWETRKSAELCPNPSGLCQNKFKLWPPA